jgi:hypothetical protein
MAQSEPTHLDVGQQALYDRVHELNLSPFTDAPCNNDQARMLRVVICQSPEILCVFGGDDPA